MPTPPVSSIPGPLLVLTGLTGVGKSDLLRALAAEGRPILDLETLAEHSGSAFGALGRPPQPSRTHFERAVGAILAPAGHDQVLWVEDTGPFLGSLPVPAALCEAIESAATVEVVAPRDARLARLLTTYRHARTRDLLRAVRRISPRLGADRTATVVRLLRAGDRRAAFAVLISYYDEGYEHRRQRLSRTRMAAVDSSRHPVPALLRLEASSAAV